MHDGRISLGIYYDFSITIYVARDVLRSLLQTPLARRPFRGCLGFRGEAVFSLERSGYQFDSDAVRTGEAKTGKQAREKARRGTPGRTCEGIQFPSSRGWRAAHTLPFGAVTPRELWSPNEWLGRAKRRITYFFFFFFARCALFQDVYKYENRTCLPTSPAIRRRRRGPLVTRALDAVRHASLTRARTRKERDARTIDLGASSDRAAG